MKPVVTNAESQSRCNKWSCKRKLFAALYSYRFFVTTMGLGITPQAAFCHGADARVLQHAMLCGNPVI
jgi:hypothetical protein